MSKDSAAITISDEQAARVLQIARDHEWREEIQKRGLVTAELAGVYEALRPGSDLGGITNFHTDTIGMGPYKPFCRCRRVQFPSKLRQLAGDLVEVNEGDRIPPPQNFRRLTAEESAGVVTLQDAQRFLDASKPSRAAAELVQSVKNEIARTELQLAQLQRKLVDLGDSLKVAQNRQAATEADIERHLEERSPEWRERVSAIAATFEARCNPLPRPDVAGPEIRSLEDIRRLQEGDSGPKAFANRGAGPELLKVTKAGILL